MEKFCLGHPGRMSHSVAWIMFYYLCIQSTGTYLIHQFDRDQSCSHLEGGSYATFEGDGHIIYLTLKMVS